MPTALIGHNDIRAVRTRSVGTSVVRGAGHVLSGAEGCNKK